MDRHDHEAAVHSGLPLTDMITAEPPLSIQDMRAVIGKLRTIRAAGPIVWRDFMDNAKEAIRCQRMDALSLSTEDLERSQRLAEVLVELFGVDLGRAQLAAKEHYQGSRRLTVLAVIEEYLERAKEVAAQEKRKRKEAAKTTKVSGVIP